MVASEPFQRPWLLQSPFSAARHAGYAFKRARDGRGGKASNAAADARLSMAVFLEEKV